MYKYGVELISSLLHSIQKSRAKRARSGGKNLIDTIESERPLKRRKRCGSVGKTSSNDTAPSLLDWMPDDLLQYIIPFLSDTKTYARLQLTCRKFRMMTNLPIHLRYLDLGGDVNTSQRDILLGINSQDEAIQSLHKFAMSGNLHALYMVGMVGIYCYGNQMGVSVLKYATQLGCARSAYTLGLILRDSSKDESDAYLEFAIKKDYLPACKEVFSSDEMKRRYGELHASQLKKYFDPKGLKNLIGHMFLSCQGVRRAQTSHCWNPMCSRWAFKTSSNRTIPKTIFPTSHRNIEAKMATIIHVSHPSIESQGNNSIINQTCTIADSEAKTVKVSRMKICSSCRRAKYCSKLCQVYDWRSQRHKMECQYLTT